jgi:hypothetical protein
MVAGLALLDRLVRISVSKFGFVGVSRGCQFSLSAWDILLVSGPVMTQDPKGLMQWSLPAFRASRCAAYDLTCGCVLQGRACGPHVVPSRASISAEVGSGPALAPVPGLLPLGWQPRIAIPTGLALAWLGYAR